MEVRFDAKVHTELNYCVVYIRPIKRVDTATCNERFYLIQYAIDVAPRHCADN